MKRLLTLDVEFDPSASAADVTAATQTMAAEIRSQFPVIQRIYIEPATLSHTPRSVLNEPPQAAPGRNGTSIARSPG